MPKLTKTNRNLGRDFSGPILVQIITVHRGVKYFQQQKNFEKTCILKITAFKLRYFQNHIFLLILRHHNVAVHHETINNSRYIMVTNVIFIHARDLANVAHWHKLVKREPSNLVLLDTVLGHEAHTGSIKSSINSASPTEEKTHQLVRSSFLFRDLLLFAECN